MKIRKFYQHFALDYEVVVVVYILEEIPEADRPLSEIKAEQPTGQAQPSSHQPPSQLMEVTELTEPIFLIAQASVSISPNCQQW
uniref:Uncharacterized protein n=1 Tax=Romanomermis culicivorax TaxID=13658 RepID=A0A915L0W7_ROMCU